MSMRLLSAVAALSTIAALAVAAPVLAASGPSERGYELVSPPDTRLYNVRPPWSGSDLVPTSFGAQGSSPDGKVATFILGAGGGWLPGMAPDGEINDTFIATRGPDGWTSVSPLSDRSGVGCSFTEVGSPITVANTGERLLQSITCPADKRRFSTPVGAAEPLDQTELNAHTLYKTEVAGDSAMPVGVRTADGVPVPRTGTAGDDDLGWSPDMNVVWFASGVELTDDPLAASQGLAVYRRIGDQVELITKTHDGRGFRLNLGLSPSPLDRPFAVSRSGAIATFTVQGAVAKGNAAQDAPMVAADTNNVQDIYQVEGSEVRWISDPQQVPADDRPISAVTQGNRIFQAASADGSKVFFSTTERLAASDADPGTALAQNLDLYMYDGAKPDGARISRVSIKSASCPECDDNASVITASGHSQAKYVTSSADGTHVFFVTGDVLTQDDDDGQQSLYVRDLVAEDTFYIAPVGVGATATAGADSGTSTAGSLVTLVSLSSSANFSNRPVAVSEDGRTLVVSLATDVSLPAGRGGPDSDGTRDVFIWRQGDGLRRVPQGLSPDANTTAVPSIGCWSRMGSSTNKARCRSVTADGSLVFVETGEALVEEDTDGGYRDVYAIAPGGTPSLVSPAGDYPADSEFIDSSASGDDVFLLTRETLDPTRDRDMGQVDLYDARTGSVVGPLEDPTGSCIDDCQSGGAQGVPVAPQTGAASSEGNVASPRRKTLAVGRLSTRARRRAARSGLLRLRIRTNRAGRVSAIARVRSGRRSQQVARSSIRVRGGTVARLKLRLSRSAKRRLKAGRSLKLLIQVRSTGARPRAITVRLPGAKS